MKNKKGFTLVELLGVIVILSMIVLVTLPALITTLTNSEERQIEEFEKSVYLAAESYFQMNSELFPQLSISGGKAYVPISTLIEEGYIKDTLVDPRTKEKIDSSASILAVLNSEGLLDYSFTKLNLSYQGYEQAGLILMYDGIQKMIGDKVEDLSPRGYHGVMLGLDSSSGWQGNRIKFDGIDDLVKQVVPVVGDFTIEVVVGNSIGALNSSHYGSVFTINDWDANGVYPSMMLFYDARSTQVLQFRTLVPANGSQESAEKTISTTNMTALKLRNTFTFIKTGSAIKVYFNNVLVGSLSESSFINRFDMTTLRLNIGSWANYYTYFDLYNIRIYNKALTEEERVANYQLDTSRF